MVLAWGKWPKYVLAQRCFSRNLLWQVTYDDYNNIVTVTLVGGPTEFSVCLQMVWHFPQPSYHPLWERMAVDCFLTSAS